jgi:hypothetical protein
VSVAFFFPLLWIGGALLLLENIFPRKTKARPPCKAGAFYFDVEQVAVPLGKQKHNP